ncbi:MAG: hypothetical protein IJN63_00480 [Clostridia bacterium]|nr:hypothetical protein [Clostridia bacterium]
MKNRWIADAMNNIDDNLVTDAIFTAKKRRTVKMHRLIAVAACLCLLTVGTFSAYAFSEDIRSFINMSFFKNNLRITEENIPEGYTPIYDAEGLDAIRNDLEGNYILMKDIRFTDADFAEGGRFAGGWEPIGTLMDPYVGCFNGNGHVVYGLRVNTTDNYGGLFGAVHARSVTEQSGVIKNLGISGAKIVVNAGEGDECCAGVIAGRAEIVAGCFVDKSEVFATFASSGGNKYNKSDNKYVLVGGLGGAIYIADSCYVNAKVSYKEYPFGILEENKYPIAYVGAFSGRSFGVINSLCLGAAEKIGDPVGEVVISDMVANVCLAPRLMNGGTFADLLHAFGISDHTDYNSMSFAEKRLVFIYMPNIALYPHDYLLYTPDPENMKLMREKNELLNEYVAERARAREAGEKVNEALMERVRTEYFDWKDYGPVEEKWYLLATNVVASQYAQIMDTINTVLSDEEWEAILIKNGMKVGIIDCYTSRQGEYKGFDMEKIWRDDKSGIPKLRIFD